MQQCMFMTRQQLLIRMWGTACRVRNLRSHVQQVGESLAQTVCTKTPAAMCSTGGAERDKGSSAVAACVEPLKTSQDCSSHLLVPAGKETEMQPHQPCGHQL